MNRERCIDESAFAEREDSSQQCVLPGTSARCSGNLHGCFARSAAALVPAASPSPSAGTMARSTVVLRRPARFPPPCAGPAWLPPQLNRSFERGFKSSLSCPSTCRISNEFACFQVSIGTQLKGRDIPSAFRFPREKKMAPMPIFVRRLIRVPSRMRQG